MTPPRTLRDRLARALFNARPTPWTWEDMSPFGQDYWRGRAEWLEKELAAAGLRIVESEEPHG